MSINVYNGYCKVMSNIPKMGHLPTPELDGLGHTAQTLGMACNQLYDIRQSTHFWVLSLHPLPY